VDPPDVQQSFEGLLDGCLDFLMLEGIRQTFAFENWPAGRLANFLDRHEDYFSSNYSRPSFLDNHDMNRFLWVVEGDKRKLQLAAMCQFSLSAAPIVYYGTEVGLSQQRDVRQGEHGIPEEARLPMLWEGQQDQDLCQYYQQLCGLRKNLASIRNGERETVYSDDQLFVFWRKAQTDQALIVLNIGSAPKKYPLPSNNLMIYMQTGEVKLTYKGKNSELSLGGWSGVVLHLQEIINLRIANLAIGGEE
jgi:glycosidase